MGNKTDILKEFDTWSEVARNDPHSFEAMRQAVIDEFIDSAPAENRDRLRRLQWRIDQERRLAGSPLGACLRIYRMMWHSVLGPGGLRDRCHEIGATIQHGEGQPRPLPSAEIVEFRTAVCSEA